MSYNEWLDIDVLEDYLDGKLDAKAMHKVEKLSLEDPFVAQAIAGLSQSRKRTQSLSLLQKQLQDRIAQKPIEKKMWAITSVRLSIAAAAAVLFIAVSVLFWLKGNKRQEMLAKNEPKKIEVTVAPQVATNKAETKVNSPINREVDKAILNNSSTAKTADLKTKTIVDKFPAVASVQSVQTDEVSAKQVATVASVQQIAKDEKLNEVAVGSSRKETERRASVMALPSKAEGIVAGYLNGKVISKDNGLPLPGATVRIAGIDRMTTTDKNGEFAIMGDSSSAQKLSVGYLGYTTKEVGVKPNVKVNVILENSSTSLSEVSISNTATNSPLGGWDSYKAYIKANNKLIKNPVAKTEVELSFVIKKDGSVNSVKVVKSAGNEMDKEAIRLLKDGPKWIYIDGKSNIGQFAIQF